MEASSIENKKENERNNWDGLDICAVKANKCPVRSNRIIVNRAMELKASQNKFE